MTRMSGSPIVVKATNNVYTVLVAVGIVAEIIAFVCLWMMNTKLFDKNLFG